jgi:cation transport regulator ChaC
MGGVSSSATVITGWTRSVLLEHADKRSTRESPLLADLATRQLAAPGGGDDGRRGDMKELGCLAR